MAVNEGLTETNTRTCTVLFGRGFIGKSLVVKLLQSENWIVRIADSSPSLVLDPDEKNSILSEALETGHAFYSRLDIRDKSQVCKVVEGSSVVFYMGAPDSTTNDLYFCYMVTVQGTKNVINACQECKVKKLIYNSSANVVFDGIHDIHNVDESLPYPWRFEDMSSDLKAQAEAMVLFANAAEGLLTCALRPSNVFGPGDPHLVPFLVREAKAGRAKFIVGNGENMCDFTYVENVAHAHICAEHALDHGTDYVAGKGIFITNLEPVKLWDFISLILEGLGYERPKFRLPAKLVLLTALLVEFIHEKLRYHLQLTPSVVRLLSCTRTFNCSKAQKNLGYSPIVSLEEGVALTIESFSHLAADSPYSRNRDFSGPSKAYKLLGSGKCGADMILWRDPKRTFTFILALILIFYWFFLSGRTLVSSTAMLLQLITVILFSHAVLPSSIFGFKVEKISSSYFEVSETWMTKIFVSLAFAWNRGVHVLRSLAQGNSWNIFLQVMGSLYFFKLLQSYSFPALFWHRVGIRVYCFSLYTSRTKKGRRLLEVSAVFTRRLAGLLTRKLPVWLRDFFVITKFWIRMRAHR